MSLLKIILIVIVSLVMLFVLLLVYALWPRIRDISDNNRVESFIDKPLILKTPAFICLKEKGQYRFNENVMTQNAQYEGSKKYDLPVGSTITIKKIKTYRNDGGSGFTNVFVLGEFISLTGKIIEFEYDWGNIDPGLYSNEIPDLPVPPWQDSTAVRIKIEK